MRTLLLSGWALLLLLATVPAVTNTHTADSHITTDPVELRPDLPINSLRDLYSNHHRGHSFRRFHPEAGEHAPVSKKISTSLKYDTSLNGQWFLLPVLPSDTAAGQFPSLHFNLKRLTFTGHTGCNTMQGSFILTDSSLHINDNLKMSKKICTGYNEAAFMKSLFQANRYTIRDSVMTLWFDQTELSRWTRKPQRGLVIKSA